MGNSKKSAGIVCLHFLGYMVFFCNASHIVSSGMKITSEKATELLKQDLGTYEKAVTSCKNLTFEPNQNQFDALVSFIYNCGAGSLSTLVNGEMDLKERKSWKLEAMITMQCIKRSMNY